MFKKIAVAAVMVAAVTASVISAGQASARVGDPIRPQEQITAQQAERQAPDPLLAFVLSHYPMPGDPHDAEASVGELMASYDGGGQDTSDPFIRSVAAEVLRNYPMPGGDDDARASFAELYNTAMAAYRRIVQVEQPVARVLVPADVVPEPWDPRDANAERLAALAAAQAPGAASKAPGTAALIAAGSIANAPFVGEVAAGVLRSFPMPGDPFDAEFSFAELYATAFASYVAR